MTAVIVALGFALLSSVLLILWLKLRHCLRRTLEDHDPFFKDSPDPLCTAGFDGYFKQVNPSFVRVLGYTAEELLADQFITFVHEDDREATLRESARLITGDDIVEFENRFRCKDGTTKWLLWNSQSDVSRRIIFASARDITRRKYLEDSLIANQQALDNSIAAEKAILVTLHDKAEALEKSNQELASFAHVVAHDLQEPLRTITSYCTIIQEDHKDLFNAATEELFGFVIDSAKRMKDLIRDLLLYGRVDSKSAEIKKILLNESMREAVLNLKISIAESQASIHCEELPEIYADSRHMVQLLQNLLGNAIKYRSEQTPIIRISAQRTAEQYTIGIQDNGIGIAPRHHTRIFGMFQRLHTRDKYEGTGIGLALCKKIIDNHKGRIWVESELGKGSTFYFTVRASN